MNSCYRLEVRKLPTDVPGSRISGGQGEASDLFGLLIVSTAYLLPDQLPSTSPTAALAPSFSVHALPTSTHKSLSRVQVSSPTP